MQYNKEKKEIKVGIFDCCKLRWRLDRKTSQEVASIPDLSDTGVRQIIEMIVVKTIVLFAVVVTQ